MAYVLVLPEAICEITNEMYDTYAESSWYKLLENTLKVEIIKNHILQFWKKIPKNGYCVLWKGHKNFAKWPP